MNPGIPLALALGVFLVATFLTGWYRRHAILDVPNDRSSHQVPTPRGGGVAIVVAALLGFGVLGLTGAMAWREVVAFGGAGAIAAAIGFADDLWSLPARWRLVAHFAAAGVFLSLLGGPPRVGPFGDVAPLWIGVVLAAVYLVWMLNLTNFMDGIDGITSVETITACAAGALLSALTIPGSMDWLPPLVLGAATAGFLVWNWPPAKIFMGDAGSGFLGIILGAFSVRAVTDESPLGWSWAILLGVFIVDTAVTLIRRVARGERFYLAHRTHAFQHATDRLGGHRPVTIAVAAINLLWLAPIAAVTAFGLLHGAIALVIAYTPLVAIAVRLGAGAPAEARAS